MSKYKEGLGNTCLCTILHDRHGGVRHNLRKQSSRRCLVEGMVVNRILIVVVSQPKSSLVFQEGIQNGTINSCEQSAVLCMLVGRTMSLPEHSY